jgi:hypothetical protein
MRTELDDTKIKMSDSFKALAAAKSKIMMLNWLQQRCEELEKGAAKWLKERDTLVTDYESRLESLRTKNEALLQTEFQELSKNIEQLTEELSIKVAECEELKLMLETNEEGFTVTNDKLKSVHDQYRAKIR